MTTKTAHYSKTVFVFVLMFGLLGLSVAVDSHHHQALAASSNPVTPTAEERLELDKYPVFNKPIEIIQSNEGSGIVEFLESNLDQTVFLDTVVYRYDQVPEEIEAQGPDKYPPSDRLENKVVQNCWGKEFYEPGMIESGDRGFPLPLNDADIQNGCATRIKFNLEHGDHTRNFVPYVGMDKLELFFAGFFKVEKSRLEDGKTLYTLSHQVIPVVTQVAFLKHRVIMDREHRPLGFVRQTEEQ